MIRIEVQQVQDKRLKNFNYLIKKKIIKELVSLTIKKACLIDFTGDYFFLVRFTNSQEGKYLNQKYRNKKYATNVLTFSYEKSPHIIADIVICLPVIYAECRKYRVGRLEHLAHMLVHGTLHALGYDHERLKDASVMEKLEEKILKSRGIDSPYI